ncbi:MAG: hypothetical protein ACOX20_06725 [Limnochordia bacterium]
MPDADLEQTVPNLLSSFFRLRGRKVSGRLGPLGRR